MKRVGVLALQGDFEAHVKALRKAGADVREVRSAEEMSRMAPFTDGAGNTDRNNWGNTYVSYYPLGGAIALALDLTLRDRSDRSR